MQKYEVFCICCLRGTLRSIGMEKYVSAWCPVSNKNRRFAYNIPILEFN